MIKQYPNDAAYAAAGKPVDESRVAQIEQTNEVKVDGVNVVVPIPGDGDAVFMDANGKEKFVRWNTINRSLLDPSWTHVGYAFGLKGRNYKVLDKAFPTTTYQWLNCWQYAITAISAATIKFWLKMKGDYANFVGIEVTLSDDTDGYINETSAAEITAALESAGNTGNVGYANHGYWAYLDGEQIIVQCDFNGSYQQYQCSDSTHALVGCTMALCVWGDMPASNSLVRTVNFLFVLTLSSLLMNFIGGSFCSILSVRISTPKPMRSRSLERRTAPSTVVSFATKSA